MIYGACKKAIPVIINTYNHDGHQNFDYAFYFQILLEDTYTYTCMKTFLGWKVLHPLPAT